MEEASLLESNIFQLFNVQNIFMWGKHTISTHNNVHWGTAFKRKTAKKVVFNSQEESLQIKEKGEGKAYDLHCISPWRPRGLSIRTTCSYQSDSFPLTGSFEQFIKKETHQLFYVIYELRLNWFNEPLHSTRQTIKPIQFYSWTIQSVKIWPIRSKRSDSTINSQNRNCSLLQLIK